MELGQILTTVFGVATIISAGLAALLLGSVQGLRADREDYRARDERRVQEIADLNTRLARAESQIATVTTERDALGAQLRSDDTIARVALKLDAVADILARQTDVQSRTTDALNSHSDKLQEHNDLAAQHWGEEEHQLADVIDMLVKVRHAIEERAS
jgi:predicted RNase H-like nuclease (RuvC/YqgF family)